MFSRTSNPVFASDRPAWWVAALVLEAALTLQSSLAPFLTLRGGVLSLTWVAVMWYALRADWPHGLAYGLAAGVCEDALSGASGVAWTFADAVTGAAVGALAGRVSRSIAAAAAATVLASLLRLGIFGLIAVFEGYALAASRAHLHAALWQAALNACGAAAVTAILERTHADRR